MKIKAYIEEYQKHDRFASQGIPLTQSEYDDKVEEIFSTNVAKNEIHGLLNDYAEKLVRSVNTLEEMAFARGAIDALKTLLKKGEKKQKAVTVIK